jgi:tripartite-type tricarboxylate transporter receptor subunit TctC
LAVEEIGHRTGAHFMHVAYKGGPQSVADLMSGRLDFGSLSAGSVIQHFESGQLKPIAVIADKRTALAPNVPTIVEQGLAPLDAGVLYLLFAPGGTPKDIVAYLSDELRKIISDPTVQARLMRGGFEPTPLGYAECAQIMRETAQSWAPLIERLKIRLE